MLSIPATQRAASLPPTKRQPTRRPCHRKMMPKTDIKKIKSHNLIVRSHPTTPKALIIDAIIVNKAGFDQDFPNIALYFSDINNRTIAQRLISPREYLSDELFNWQTMPSEQPIHISLEILDPGKEAVNYTLKFFNLSQTPAHHQ